MLQQSNNVEQVVENCHIFLNSSNFSYFLLSCLRAGNSNRKERKADIMGKPWWIRARVYRWFRKVFPISRFYRSECERIQDLLELIENHPQRILDLGTGIGESLSLLPDSSLRVQLDRSRHMLKQAPNNPNDRKIQGDILHLPFKSEQFDLITCIGTSEYIREKDILLQEAYRVLKDGGYLLITFSPPNIYNRLRNLLGKRIYTLSGSKAHDLAAAYQFFIVRAYRTTMQSQYLLQKTVFHLENDPARL